MVVYRWRSKSGRTKSSWSRTWVSVLFIRIICYASLLKTLLPAYFLASWLCLRHSVSSIRVPSDEGNWKSHFLLYHPTYISCDICLFVFQSVWQLVFTFLCADFIHALIKSSSFNFSVGLSPSPHLISFLFRHFHLILTWRPTQINSLNKLNIWPNFFTRIGER